MSKQLRPLVMGHDQFAHTFASEPYTQLYPDERIVTVGFSIEAPESLVPHGMVVSVDTMAEDQGSPETESADDRLRVDSLHLGRIACDLAASSVNSQAAIRRLRSFNPNRVAVAHYVDTVPEEFRYTVLNTLLAITGSGMLQIYPVRSQRVVGIADYAAGLDYYAMTSRVGVGALRSLLHLNRGDGVVLTLNPVKNIRPSTARQRLADLMTICFTD